MPLAGQLLGNELQQASSLACVGERIQLACAGKENLAGPSKLAQQSKFFLQYQTANLARQGEARQSKSFKRALSLSGMFGQIMGNSISMGKFFVVPNFTVVKNFGKFLLVNGPFLSITVL